MSAISELSDMRTLARRALVVFYRSSLMAADTAPVAALMRRSRREGLGVDRRRRDQPEGSRHRAALARS